ncbi:hypothetical protein QWY85_08170 [Neolewinella lacunae]|uniref:Uncharacterized protein n=1 Tax=Neolewinella lacunae TaxID=1517758 RepID=A0A923TCX5_9BACT|nr:hypothetical protein [Neolewinella lacunae]MBC6994212.1 hypothetical protein [Neolewinella lacunae]MDN3634629.1 hypothetical protein [Neolewinella lacunae]
MNSESNYGRLSHGSFNGEEETYSAQGSAVSDNVVQYSHETYGMTEAEYNAYLSAGEESARLCDDIHYYLFNTPNAAAYFY